MNMGGYEVVLESVSGDQRHRRGGKWSGVIGGPCAVFSAAWRDDSGATALDALAFALRAGIWPNRRPRKMYQPLLGIHRSKFGHVFFFLIFFS